MITTDSVPGSPCWLDLGVPDVDAAAAFYRSVFGWEHLPYGPEAGGYGAFQLDGVTVAALGPLTEPGARAAWTVYFRVDNAEAAALSVERLGGTVRVVPIDVGVQGKLAQFTDPQGGRFAVWQPGETRGLGRTDAPGSLCWTELYTTDSDGATEFYGSLFGWDTTDMALPGGGGVYRLVGPPGAEDDQTRMHGGIMRLPSSELTLTGGKPYWHPVFAVTDCDRAVARVTEGGGSVQMGPEDAEGVGRLAVCVDPWGADFVVLRPATD